MFSSGRDAPVDGLDSGSTPPRRVRGMRRWLPALALLLAIIACGGPALVTNKPASQLNVAIQIKGQYTGAGDVLVDFMLYEGNSLDHALPPDKAKVTCDGVDVTPTYSVFERPCPWQPAGGAYTVVYTDQNGHATTLNVPIPAGRLTLDAPLIGSTVPIPTDGALTVRYTTPLTPQGYVAIEDLSVGCGALNAASCGSVVADLRGNSSAITRGGAQTFRLTGDYSTFQPNAGMIQLNVKIEEPFDPGEFVSATVTYLANDDGPITWTR